MSPRLLALAAALAVWHLWLAVDWVRKDRQPPPWDPAVHLGTALDYKEAAGEGRWLDLLRTKPRPGHPQYPIAYHYSLLPVLGAEAPHRAVVFVNLLYFFVFVGAAAWLAWLVAGETAAAAALAVMALSPGLLFKFREAFPDLSLAAWTTLAYAFALKSKGFTDRRWSYAAGAAAGLAVLSKWGAVLYLLPVVVWGLRRPQFWRALGLAAALSLPWYLINTVSMLPRIWTSVTLGHHQGQPLTWTWDNWLFYGRWLADCFTLPGALILLAGCVLALRKRTPARLVLAGWLGFSYLFCTLVPSKDWRYFLPAAAALPALGAAGLPAAVSAGVAGLAAWKHKDRRQPQLDEWPDFLAEVKPGSSLCLLANHYAVNATTLSWEARRRGLDIHFGGHQTDIPEWSDYVLLKTGDPGVFLSEPTQRILSAAGDPKSLFNKVFRPARRWALPDGSQAVLYAHRPDLPLIKAPRRFAQLTVRGNTLEDVRVKPLGPGRYAVTAGALKLKKLAAPIRDVRVELSEAKLYESGGRVYVLALGRVRLLGARARGGELAEAVSKRAKLRIPLTLEAGAVRLRALSLIPTVVEGVLRLRAAALGLSWTLSVPLPKRPFALELAPIHITPEELYIGA